MSMTLEDSIDRMIVSGKSYGECKLEIETKWFPEDKAYGLVTLERKANVGLFNRQPSVNRIDKGGLLINK
jgi:hypothetical protein